MRPNGVLGSVDASQSTSIMMSTVNKVHMHNWNGICYMQCADVIVIVIICIINHQQGHA